MPTAEQFADWYVTAPRDERVAVAERLLAAGGEASRCFTENHESLQAEVEWTRARATRYHAAWLSARRRIHPDNLLRAFRAATEEPA
jgi:hypothetical protein